ncbi:MAG: amidohydrolase family protein [bacterium]|nr:amidohydrolase family protein [bacterium]
MGEGKSGVIDMHTHIWPDKMAGRTVKALQEIAEIPAFSDGTLKGLKECMKKSGVTLSVILPVVTKPEQFETVNKVAAQLSKEPGIISFGGIHPLNDHKKKKLLQIKELGLKGIKLHPDYQKTFFDDPSYIEIVKDALNMGLIVSTHAGVDVGLPSPVHCSPKEINHLYEELQLGDNVDNKLILAHTGGCDCWEEVLDTVAGKKVYLDISFTMGRIPDALFLEIVHKHGADHMVFGTDSPWSSAKETIAWIKGLPLSKEEKEDLLYRTAGRLLAEY